MNVLIDLDGTLVDGGQALPGAVGFLRSLVEARVPTAVMTNSVAPPDTVRSALVALGFPIAGVPVLNPISVVNNHIQAKGYRRVRAVGTERELSQLTVVPQAVDPELIVLLDFEGPNADFLLLQELLDRIRGGVPALAASRSLYYRKNGALRLDTGSFVELLERATGQPVVTVGKPSSVFFEAALSCLGADALDTVMVGDDGATDVAGGRAAGLATVLVRSGKYRPGDEKKFPPDHVAGALSDLSLSDLERISNQARAVDKALPPG